MKQLENLPHFSVLLPSRISGENHRIDHCVNPGCPNFGNRNPGDSSWYHRYGSYNTRAFGRVQRFRCTHCRKTFSSQSFSIDYYVKKPVDYLPLLVALVSTSGQGNICRFSGIREECLQNRMERLSRCFLAVHARLRRLIRVQEDLVLDGFESFARSQYFPNNVNILSGSQTEYIYSMGFAQLRRKGRMSETQRRQREHLEILYGRANPKEVELSVISLLEDACRFLKKQGAAKRALRTDEHKAYVRAVGKVRGFPSSLEHRRYSSRAARTVRNPLFAANYADRQLRKDQANHVRESVQFSRCPSAMMIRLTVYQIYHNYLVPRRVREHRRGNWQTRGERQGIERRSILRVFQQSWGRRAFLHKLDLWKEERKTWSLQWRNSRIPMGRYVPLYIRA